MCYGVVKDNRWNRGMIKIVFFDIDGTLVSFKTHKVPFSTREAISELRKKGIKVFVATGRHKATIDNLDDIEFDGYITMNGAYCFAGDKVIFKEPIPKSNIDKLIEFQKNSFAFPVFFMAEHKLCVNYYNDDVHHLIKMINFPILPVEPIEDMANREIFQMVSFVDEDKAKSVLPLLVDCSDARWYHTFTDVINRNVSKKVGVAKVLEYYGFSQDEAMAFGDGGNDIPMLQAVTNSVAMGNAEQSVKSVSNYVTDTVDDDGILKALKHFSLI